MESHPTYPQPYCLVLSGGGARGMYHIGVWRALRELNVPVNAFIGNSIGAIISAFLAQGLHEELEAIGDTIGIETIIKVPEGLVKDGGFHIDRSRLSAFREFSKSVMGRRGIDTSPMRDLIYRTLDEDKIRNSGVDLGVVTFNLTDLKPREVFIERMEPGKLKDYVLASAAFPGFDRPVIKGKRHMDGGVYNNLPHDLAVSRGYKNIIVVDVSGMGVNRRVNPRGTNTIYVKISAEIGGVMDFDRDTLNQLRTLGYLDTMKTFGRFVGNRYFLDPNEIWERRFTAFLERRLGAEYLDRLDLMKVLPPGLRHERRVLYPLLDSAASALEIERIRSYTYSELCSAIVQAKAEVDRRTEQISSQVERRRFMRTVRRIRRGRRSESELPRSPYYYSQLLGGPSTSAAGTMARRTLRAIYPALIGADFVLPLIEEFTQTTELPNQ